MDCSDAPSAWLIASGAKNPTLGGVLSGAAMAHQSTFSVSVAVSSSCAAIIKSFSAHTSSLVA